MIDKRLMITLPFLIGSNIAFAENYVDYKCYLETTAGNKVVYFSWEKSKVQTQLANIVTKTITVDGSVRAVVKHRIECTKAKNSFSNKEASVIDSVFLK